MCCHERLGYHLATSGLIISLQCLIAHAWVFFQACKVYLSHGRAMSLGIQGSTSKVWQLLLHIEDFSKFFGPSPRKHRLTVYRGSQVTEAGKIAGPDQRKLCVNMVRSTLLQVQGGRQNAQGPILHFVVRDPLCAMISPHEIYETN